MAALLAAALAWRAFDAHSANAALYRKLCDEEAELVREETRQKKLRAELEAIERDPLYVESLLRQARQVEPGETIVERR